MNFTNAGVQGADVSFYQDNNTTPQQIDFTKMVGQGASFVIVRAGQKDWVDSDFEYNWQKARDAGLPRGAYWFYDSRIGPEYQASLFASLFGDKPELELWMDIEENYGGAFAGWQNWKLFLEKLKKLTTSRIGIYTGYGYIKGKIPSSEYAYFNSYPLWLAWYTSKAEDVIVPAPWSSCLYWQWGTPALGHAWGCESTEIDMNLFNGTKKDFNERYGLQGEIVEHYYKVTPNVSGEYRSIRAQATPNILGAKVGQINAGSFGKCRTDDVKVYASDVYVSGILRAKAGDRWLHCYEANGQPVDGWVAEIHLGQRYLNVEEIGLPVVTLTHTIEVYSDGSVRIDGNPVP